jgi:hypothetical protein
MPSRNWNGESVEGPLRHASVNFIESSRRFVGMSFEKLSDASVLHLYENIRQQLDSDIRNGRYRFMGEAAKRRAEDLRAEIDRRQLYAPPIDWP